MFDRSAKYAFLSAMILMIACRIGFTFAVDQLNLHLEKHPVPLREQLSNIPERLGRWEAYGQDHVLDLAVIEELGTDQYLDRVYAIDGDPKTAAISVHIAYYTGMIDAIPHIPDRCFVAGGLAVSERIGRQSLAIDRSAWVEDELHTNRATKLPYQQVTFNHHITGRPMTVRMPVGDFELRTTEFQDPRTPEMRLYAGFMFIANGRVTSSPEDVKALAFNLRETHAYYCKIQFTMIDPHGGGPERYADLVSELLGELLPGLMRCLPDWSDIESFNQEEIGRR